MKTRLYRNKNEKVIAGVCSGLSDYFDIDVVILRVVFLSTALIWGISILIYIFFWIAMPVRTEEMNASSVENDVESSSEGTRIFDKQERSKRAREIVAIVLIVTGIFATLDNLLSWLSGRMWIPMVLITLGILVLFYTTNGKNKIENENRNV